MRPVVLILGLIVVVALKLNAADIPRQIEYQGRLTDPSGAPVADGDYLIRFNLYDGPDAGATQLWSSNFQQLSVTNGLVSYMLGSNVPLPDNIFDDSVSYLGIKVSTDPELIPRIRMVSVPFAYRARSADTVTSPLYALTTGDTLTGELYFDFDNNGQWESRVGGSAAGGKIELADGSGTTRIGLDAGAVGDQSVQLPDGAITIGEFDSTQVPISQAFNLFPLIIKTSSTDYVAIDSFTVTVPRAGNVVVSVTGACNLDIKSSSSNSVTGVMEVGICIDPGGLFCSGTYEALTFQDADNSDDSYETKSFSVVYQQSFVSAGSQTLYVVLRADPLWPAEIDGYPQVQVSFTPKLGYKIWEYHGFKDAGTD